MSAFGLFIAALAMVVGIIVGYVIRKVSYEKQIAQAHNSAEGIIAAAKKMLRRPKRGYFRGQRRKSQISGKCGARA